MGLFLDPDADGACKSWTAKDRKPMSGMYQRMLVGFGVKQSVVNAYKKSAQHPKKLKHGK